MKRYLTLAAALLVGSALLVEGQGLQRALTRTQSLFITSAGITPTTAAGTTVMSGAVARQVYKVTVDKAAFTANATTMDVTLATLPAKTFLMTIFADVTQQFACTAVCTSTTLSMTVGNAAGGNQYLLSFDVDAAAAVFGDAVAELGASLKTATTPAVAIGPTPLGALGAWGTTSSVQIRMTSGTGNLGNGSATNLSAGSVTFYLVTERLP